MADELPDAFIQKLNAAAKREKPDALVIGEVWEDASNKIAYSERRKYFQGGELDSVMNYPLRDAILAFLNGGTAEHFAETMECIRENYPRNVFYNLVSDMKDVNPQKLHMDICGINKKYKLELANPTVKDVEGWVEKI